MTPTTEPTPNSFEQTLREMRHGRSLTDLSLELERLIEAVKNTGKAGALTYKLVIKPASAGDTITVQLEDDVTTRMPKAPRGSSIFFVTEQHTLQRGDPRQREFVIHTVAKAPEAAPVSKAG